MFKGLGLMVLGLRFWASGLRVEDVEIGLR